MAQPSRRAGTPVVVVGRIGAGGPKEHRDGGGRRHDSRDAGEEVPWLHVGVSMLIKRPGLAGRADMPISPRRSVSGIEQAATARSGQYALMADSRPMEVLTPNGVAEEWTVWVEMATSHRSASLTLVALDGRAWRAEQVDVFECLLSLRDQVEPLGIRLCCNGARRGAWASGMQRDMGMGTSVYLLAETVPGKRQVQALDPAPAESIVSVQEQRTWYSDWLARRSR